MNIRYVLAFMLLVVSQVSLAACLTKETTIFFVNGVNVDEDEARASVRLIKERILQHSGVNPECVGFTYAYNANEPLALDFIEAGIQKTKELSLDLKEFWKRSLRVLPYVPVGWFDDLVDTWYAAQLDRIQDIGYILGDQVDEHLSKYRAELHQDRQVILVPHSQGSLYANEEWARMTAEEQAATHIVAVASPADKVEDGGPHTTLQEDSIALLFPFALEANASNGNSCEDNWVCHSFDDSYLRGQNSRDKIVGDIVALLPKPVECMLSGRVYGMWWGQMVVGGTVLLYRNEPPYDLILAKDTDSDGRYCINVGDGSYGVAAVHDPEYLGYTEITLSHGIGVVLDFPIPVLM